MILEILASRRYLQDLNRLLVHQEIKYLGLDKIAAAIPSR